MKSIALTSLILALFGARTAAIGSPVGFATGTTGGAGGVTVTPTTQAELITYLSDNTARTIILTKIFDFTSYYGTTSGQACKPWSCSPNPQMLLSTSVGGCENYTKYNVTYNTAGASKNLVVASNKTILGQGSNAGIKGIGLRMNGVTNIIIQSKKRSFIFTREGY
ncbi:hypothetical protein M407DRAFT_25742 [Tulasnella calospora MUT 4182]|uniref:Polysaccharide lyase family 1 protein n=1 Tax=Tulasnella calospora MUT 4182 TaxID=1051891 RepID=A0A0C3LU41_9AGAM|nr:hypothetical protein M407DRAFT_25742 [Tulasnella calospora MUT 4182]